MLNWAVHKAVIGLYIILPPHISLCLQSDVFHPALLDEILFDFFTTFTRATFPAHLLLSDLAVELDLCIMY
jgi:hypothetical protein